MSGTGSMLRRSHWSLPARGVRGRKTFPTASRSNRPVGKFGSQSSVVYIIWRLQCKI